MGGSIRYGAVVKAILIALRGAKKPLSGYEIMVQTRYASGSVYPALTRLTDKTEPPLLDFTKSPSPATRRKGTYSLTEAGRDLAEKLAKPRR